MKLWKVLGLAGLAGVAATGAIIARDQRKRALLTPDEVLARLRQRVEQTAAERTEEAELPGQPDSTESSARA
jgi:hypothetical protein